MSIGDWDISEDLYMSREWWCWAHIGISALILRAQRREKSSLYLMTTLPGDTTHG